MAKKAAASENVMDLLGAQAKKTDKDSKKKDDMPVLELPNTEENRKVIDDWIKYKREEKAAKTKKEKQEAKLKPLAITARTDYCLKERKHITSVKVKVGEDEEDKVGPDKKIIPGRKSETVTCAFQSGCAAIAADKKARLVEIFGKDEETKKDKFDDYFELKTNLKITDAVMAKVQEAKEGEQTVIHELMKVLGKDRFFEIFEVTQFINVKDKLFEEYVTNKELNEQVAKAEGEGLVTPKKPLLNI